MDAKVPDATVAVEVGVFIVVLVVGVLVTYVVVEIDLFVEVDVTLLVVSVELNVVSANELVVERPPVVVVSGESGVNMKGEIPGVVLSGELDVVVD